MPTLKKHGVIHATVTGYNFRVDKPLFRKAAIRQKCLECCCGNAAEVRRCHIADCTLWPWRTGRIESLDTPVKAHDFEQTTEAEGSVPFQPGEA